MSAPKRIWAYNDRSGYGFTALGNQPKFQRVEYVRADLHEALAKRVKMLEGLVFSAYQEGWAAAGGHWRSNSGWETSESRAALSTEGDGQ
jgi:hypothetical protein